MAKFRKKKMRPAWRDDQTVWAKDLKDNRWHLAHVIGDTSVLADEVVVHYVLRGRPGGDRVVMMGIPRRLWGEMVRRLDHKPTGCVA